MRRMRPKGELGVNCLYKAKMTVWGPTQLRDRRKTTMPGLGTARRVEPDTARSTRTKWKQTPTRAHPVETVIIYQMQARRWPTPVARGKYSVATGTVSLIPNSEPQTTTETSTATELRPAVSMFPPLITKEKWIRSQRQADPIPNPKCAFQRLRLIPRQTRITSAARAQWAQRPKVWHPPHPPRRSWAPVLPTLSVFPRSNKRDLGSPRRGQWRWWLVTRR